MPNVPSITGNIPCSPARALVANCKQCHGAEPVGGAPMPLVTLEDFHKPAKTDPSKKVYELVQSRIKDKARPMPPGGQMDVAQMNALDTWLSGGAKAGTDADKECGAAPTGPNNGAGPGDYTTGLLKPLPGETCYEFPVHDSPIEVDDQPYEVTTGEHYQQFYYAAPWPEGTVATRYATSLDNKALVHHWLLFGTDELDPPGSHRTAPLPTLLGVNAQLLAGWAVGGVNLALPEDVGFELPPPGHTLNIQWHYYNSTGSVQKDRSIVQVCTVPRAMRQHVATITWVGTEDLGGDKFFGGPGMPPHQVSKFSGTCDPLRLGMNATDPIKIIGFWPHMHQLGTNMQATINKPDGTKQIVFDKPFDFNYQVHHMQRHDLNPGETLTATCTFNNTTDRGVPFGESTDTEMCYNFTLAYPAHALENGVISLIGATNTCW